VARIYGYTDTEVRLLDKLPKEVESLDDIARVHKDMKEEFDSIENKGLRNKFSRWKKKRKINKIEDHKDSSLHQGAKGEQSVLDKLDELPDYYHVLCGVDMDLGRYVTYKRRKSKLRSAQMDFVVVSQRGVVLIEVKNWSDEYAQKHHRFSPHEQVDRAGLVLWIKLKSSWFSPKNPYVKNVLLATQGNIKYNHKYNHVSVSDLKSINYFIQGREKVFSDKEVKRVVDRIYKHIVSK